MTTTHYSYNDEGQLEIADRNEWAAEGGELYAFQAVTNVGDAEVVVMAAPDGDVVARAPYTEGDDWDELLASLGYWVDGEWDTTDFGGVAVGKRS